MWNGMLKNVFYDDFFFRLFLFGIVLFKVRIIYKVMCEVVLDVKLYCFFLNF